jgi:hypothetical protein
MAIDFKGEGKPKELVPAGAHIATIYSIVQLGTMAGEYMGKATRKNKIRITWELPEETREFDGEMKPMVVGKTYTASLYDQSKLRPIVDGILGSVDEETFDISSLLGKSCMIQVSPAEYNGNEYADVVSCTQLPKSVPAPKPFNPQVYLDYKEGWDETVYEALPKWMKDKMAESEEMKARNGSDPFNPTEEVKPEDIPF